MGPLLTLNLDGTERQVHSDLWRVWLMPGEPEAGVVIRVQIDPDSKIRWEELDKLVELVELEYGGRDSRVQDYLSRRHDIHRFGWSGHQQSQIDLSRTAIAELSLNASDGPLEVRLPSSGSLRRLSLALPADPGLLRFVPPEKGARIHLMLNCSATPDGPTAIAGLEAIRALSLFNVRQLRIGELVPYQQLEELTVIGPPGGIPDLEELTLLPRLKKLFLRDCYGLNAAGMPRSSALPKLESVEIDGIRRADADLLTERLGKRTLSIRGKRSDAWLRANLDNPFREWPEEHGVKVGKAAMAAYRKAAAALERPGELEAVRTALHGFMTAINKLSEREPFDTIQREQVMDAFDELASQAGDILPSETAETWFEEWDDT